MAYDLAKVTDSGNNLVAGIIADKASLSIDKIEVSGTQLPSTTDITKLTSIPNIVQTIQANGYSKNDNTLIISSVLDNSKITADYKAWVFGIWGSDSQNGQSILMAVVTTTNAPDTIPAYSGSTPVSFTYKFNIGFSNASNVRFDMITGAFATNDTVVHTTGDETVDGKKAFKADPVDKNGDAYITGKGIPSNIATLDDVAKKVTDNKDGSIIVNGKTFVPADDSNTVHKSGDEEVAGTKTFDIAPLLKSNGKPFITVDDVPKVDTTKLVNTDGSADGNITNTKLTVKDGQMFLDGYPIMGYGVATDKDDATAKSAKYPGVMFIW
ncbi:MAG: hypothetical protein ABF753_03460 [Lentilactobacillus hilgardii]|uniref:hypothetical protein n=1 Tax=Lentilactobacillus hilgardii TaxID=1588 RepID=UPI0039ED0EF6